MRYTLLIKFALQRLWEGRLKSQLTFAGLTVSVLFMVLLLGIGYGLDNAVSESLRTSSADKQISVTPSTGQLHKIDSDAFDEVKAFTGIANVQRKADLYGKIAYNGTYLDVIAQAVDPEYLKMTGYSTPSETVFDYNDQEQFQLLIVNRALAEAYGFKSDLSMFKGKEVSLDIFLTPNNSVAIENEEAKERRVALGNFKVLDVRDEGETPYLYMPRKIAESAGVAYDSSLQVTVNDADTIPDLRTKIEALGYSTESMSESIGGINRFFRLFRIALILFSLITLVIATIGLLNLISSEISDRREEISFMRLIGFGEFDIRGTIIYECVVMSIVGTIAGIAFGFGVGRVLNTVFSYLSKKNHFQYFDLFFTPLSIILVLISFSIVFGIGIGYIASRKAKKIPASLGLRNE